MSDRVDRVIAKIRAIHKEVGLFIYHCLISGLTAGLILQCLERPDRDGKAQDIVIVSHGKSSDLRSKTGD